MNFPYFVLMGDVGSGKSTLCEKMTGLTGLSSNSSTSFTRDSKVFPVDKRFWLADTPGVKASKGRLDHALNLLGAFRYRPVTAFLCVVSLKDRLDGLVNAVCELVSPFTENFENNIAVIVCKHDLQPQIKEDSIRASLVELGLKHVLVANKDTTNQQLLTFLDTLATIRPVDVTIAPQQLTSYFDLADADLKLRAKYNRFIKKYKELADSGIQHLGTLKGSRKMDFAFSFKSKMYELIPEFQSRFTTESGGDGTDEKTLIYSTEMKKEFKRQLLEVRIHCKEYIFGASPTYGKLRKCPHCGNVWVLVEGCHGTTTCGSRPNKIETSRPFYDVFTWDLQTLFTSDFNWKDSVNNARPTKLFTDSEASEIINKAEANWQGLTRVMEAIQRSIFEDFNTALLQIRSMDPELKNRLLQRWFRAARIDLDTSLWDDKVLVNFIQTRNNDVLGSLSNYFHKTLSTARKESCAQTSNGTGTNPELAKPCGKEIAWKDMAPVAIPPEWETEWKDFDNVADVKNSSYDEVLEKKLASKSVVPVLIGVDDKIACAFRNRKSMKQWKNSTSCIIRVTDTIRGRFFFPLSEAPPTTSLHDLLTTHYPNQTQHIKARVDAIQKKNENWNGLLPDEIRSISYYTADVFYKDLNCLLHHRTPTPLTHELDLTDHLLTALSKCPSCPGKVYRGLSGVRATADSTTQYVVGKYVIWVSFTSCSRNLSVANRFSSGTGPRTLFEIQQTSGVDIAPISVYQQPWHDSEEETLLTPNVVFRVENVVTLGELDTISLVEVSKDDLLCIMECLDPNAAVSSDDTPWTTSLAFLQEDEVKM